MMRAGDPRGGGEDSGGGAGGLLEPAARPAAAPHQVTTVDCILWWWWAGDGVECVDIVTPGVSILSGGCRQGWAHANIYCLTSNSGCVQGDAGDGGPGN